jgi:hypothetical protein
VVCVLSRMERPDERTGPLVYVRSDALVGVETILAGLDEKLGVGKPTAAAIRSKELAHRIATEPADSMPFPRGGKRLGYTQ